MKSSQSLVGEPQCPCLCTSIVGRQGNGVLKWATTPHSHNMSLNWENDKPCEFRVTSFSTNLVLNGFISHQSPRLQQSDSGEPSALISGHCHYGTGTPRTASFTMEHRVLRSFAMGPAALRPFYNKCCH